jgi:hypothetical protein
VLRIDGRDLSGHDLHLELGQNALPLAKLKPKVAIDGVVSMSVVPSAMDWQTPLSSVMSK